MQTKQGNVFFFWSEGVNATLTWRGSNWSNPCYSGPEYMFRGNYLQDSRGGVITPRILGGGVNNLNNPPYLRHWVWGRYKITQLEYIHDVICMKLKCLYTNIYLQNWNNYIMVSERRNKRIRGYCLIHSFIFTLLLSLDLFLNIFYSLFWKQNKTLFKNIFSF